MTAAEANERSQVKKWLAAAEEKTGPIDGSSISAVIGAALFACSCLMEVAKIQQKQIERLQNQINESKRQE